MYLPQHWGLKKSYFHSPEVEKDSWKSSSPFCSLSSCQQSEVLNGTGENHLPAFPGSAASPVPGHGGMITPLKSDYNPSNKMVTLSVQGCILILCFLHFISRVKPKENFFSFGASGGSKTEILKVLEESRKGEQSPVAIRRLCFLSLCRSKVISGPESHSLSMAGSRNRAFIL